MPKEIKEKIIKAWTIIHKGYIGYENIDRKFLNPDSEYKSMVISEYEGELRDYLKERKQHGLHRLFKVVPCEIKILCPKKK